MDDRQAYIKILGKCPPLTAAEHDDVLARIAAGDQAARTRLAESYVRLAYEAARRWYRYGRAGRRKLDLFELIAVANEALVIAAHNFDPKRNSRFLNYALRIIKRRISEFVDRDTLVPARAWAHKYWHAQAAGRPLPKIRQIPVRPPVQSLSLSYCGTDGDGEEIMPFLPAPNADPADVIAARDEIEFWRERVRQLDQPTDSADDSSPGLNPLAKQIVTMFFGLENQEPMRVQAIANQLGIKRPRASHWLHRGLAALRESCPEPVA